MLRCNAAVSDVSSCGHTRAALGPKTKLILLAAPAAAEYYPHIGFERHESAWLLHEDQAIR